MADDRKRKAKEEGRPEPLERKPTGESAVALAYDPGRLDLPRIKAKGRGRAAEELLRIALENNIPIRYDPDLVQVLSNLDVGAAIPEEVFLVVAEIMAFVYRVNQDFS